MGIMKNYIGSYKNIYICQSKDKKILKKSSSGGFVTSSLIYALKNKIIDATIVVSMSNKQPWKYEVRLAKTEKDIISSAGSKYTIIPLNEFLKIANNNQKINLAMVGLPCHITAIKQLQKKGLYKNIKLLIGLFCGYNMPFKATEFLIKKSKIKHNQIKTLEYRGNNYPGGFLIKSNKKKFFLPKGYYDFLNLTFVPKGCLRCKDYTNELADISVGDAWNWDNSSVVIPRTELGNILMKNSSITNKKIDEKELLRMHWHNIKHKKIGDSLELKAIMFFIKTFGRIIPFWAISPIIKRRTRTKRMWSLKEVEKYLDDNKNPHPKRLKDVYHIANIKDNSYILDYCIRTGDAASYFASKKKNLKFLCINMSSKMLKVKSERFKSESINFKTKLIKTTMLPIKERTFDNLLCFETLEYLPNPEITVKELARVTKTNGEVIITISNRLGHFTRMFSNLIRTNNFPYLPIPGKEMIKYIKRAGFKIKIIKNIGSTTIFLCEKI